MAQKRPRSLVIGWDFLDENHDALTTGSARYEAVLSIGRIEQTPARSHYGQNIEKILIPTPQHTS